MDFKVSSMSVSVRFILCGTHTESGSDGGKACGTSHVLTFYGKIPYHKFISSSSQFPTSNFVGIINFNIVSPLLKYLVIESRKKGSDARKKSLDYRIKPLIDKKMKLYIVNTYTCPLQALKKERRRGVQ